MIIDDSEFWDSGVHDLSIYRPELPLHSDSLDTFMNELEYFCRELLERTSSLVKDAYAFGSSDDQMVFIPITASDLMYNIISLLSENLWNPVIQINSYVWLSTYRYSIMRMFSRLGNTTPELRIELNVKAHIHGYGFSYLVISLLTREHFHRLSELLDLDLLWSKYYELLKNCSVKDIVEGVIAIHRMESRIPEYDFADLMRDLDNILSKIIKKIDQGNATCLEPLLRFLTILRNVTSNQLTENLIMYARYLAHNILSILLFLNAMNNLMLVIPSVSLSIEPLRGEGISLSRIQVPEEVDFVVMGWTSDPQSRSLDPLNLMPFLLFVEATFTKGSFSDRKRRQLENLKALDIVCQHINRATRAICRAAVLMPCNSSTNHDYMDGVPIICLEEVVDPIGFADAVFRSLHRVPSNYSSSTSMHSEDFMLPSIDALEL